MADPSGNCGDDMFEDCGCVSPKHLHDDVANYMLTGDAMIQAYPAWPDDNDFVGRFPVSA